MPGQHPLIQKLYEFVYAEQAANLQKLNEVWERPLPEKLLQGWTQGFARLERSENPGKYGPTWAKTSHAFVLGTCCACIWVMLRVRCCVRA